SGTAVTKYDLIGTGDHGRVEEVVLRRIVKREPGIDPRLAGVYRSGVFDIRQRRDSERTYAQSRVVGWRHREVGAAGATRRGPCPGRRRELLGNAVGQVLEHAVGKVHRQSLYRVRRVRGQRVVGADTDQSAVERRIEDIGHLYRAC